MGRDTKRNLDRTSSRGNNSNASNDANTNNNNNNYENRKEGNITSNARTVNIKQVESSLHQGT